MIFEPNLTTRYYLHTHLHHLLNLLPHCPPPPRRRRRRRCTTPSCRDSHFRLRNRNTFCEESFAGTYEEMLPAVEFVHIRRNVQMR